jgi:acetate kinase
MKIFVVNSGSSSIKYQLFHMPSTSPVCSGQVERIGERKAGISHKIFSGKKQDKVERELEITDHEAGLKEVVKLLTDKENGVIQKPEEIDTVGHRVVHGGENYASTTEINQEVKEQIKKLFPLAPLHNPSNYQGIEVAEKIFPQARQVAVFDTAFHQSMPEKAYRYAIPHPLYHEQGIRAYGFHGTSHKYVSQKAADYLQKPDARLISIHLGNGCSMTAIRNGKSLDTSMGFGPLSGLVMGTRSGDIDPSIIFYLIREEGYSADEVKELLNKKSGMQGLAGHNDMRDILKAIEEGKQEAKLAFELYAYRIRKYIGAYAAALNGLDAIIFTAGVGENAGPLREEVCREMEFLGIRLDEKKNRESPGDILEISRPDSPVKALVIPTNEELEIARQSYELLGEKK